MVARIQEALLYAPMSNVGAITYDKDAVYIDMPQIHFSGGDDVQDWGSDEEGAKAASVRRGWRAPDGARAAIGVCGECEGPGFDHAVQLLRACARCLCERGRSEAA